MEQPGYVDSSSAVTRPHAERLSELGAQIARVAHELKTPVSLIAGSLENLDQHLHALMRYAAATRTYIERDPRVASAYVEGRVEYVLANAETLLAICDEGVQRLNYIVDQLRGYTRREDELGTANLDLADLLARAERLARGGRPRPPTVDWQIPSLPAVAGREQELLQAFTNIIGNAFDAATSQRQPRVGIVATHDGEGLEVRIRDNGPGVPAATRATVFEPFFTTKARSAGLGLGLSIAREALEKHGGSIEIAPDDGTGAEFIVRLPVAAR